MSIGISKVICGLLAGVAIAAGSTFVAGSAQATEQTASASGYPAMTLRVADDIAKSHPTSKALYRWQDLLSKATGGKIQLKVFPNAVLGSTDSQMTQLEDGSLDIVVLGGVSLLGKYNPEANIELLPFMFPSDQVAMKALDGPYGDWLKKKIIAPAGFQAMCWMDNGLRDLGNNVRPIVKPEDMRGLKFRVANVELLLEFFKQVNATAVPMPFTEVFTALQQGTVDGFENPPAVFNSNHFDEVTKYMSLTGHAFTAYVPVMDLKKFHAYPANVQKVLLDTARQAATYQRDLMYKYNGDSIAALKKRGMKVNKVDRAAFVKAVKPIWDRFKAKYGDTGINLALKAQD